MITRELLLAHMIDIDSGMHMICRGCNFHESYTGPYDGPGQSTGEQAWVEYVDHIENAPDREALTQKERLN